MQRGAIEHSLVEAFEAAKGSLGGSGAIAAARVRALEALAADGLPTRRDEAWHYTDLRSALKELPPLPASRNAPASDAPLGPSAGFLSKRDCHVLTFVDGVFDPERSSTGGEEGLEVVSFAEAIEDGATWLEDVIAQEEASHTVAQLGTAFAGDGAAIRVTEGAAASKPVHLKFLSTGSAAVSAHMRIALSLGRGAALTLFETHAGGGETAGLKTVLSDVHLAEEASLVHMKLQDETADATHLALARLRLAADARFSGATLSMGSRLARHETQVTFEGEGAEARVAGAYLLSGAQHLDNTTIMNHAVPGCRSNTLFKGVLDARSVGVFQGKVVVAPDAQQTDGQQMTNALLLSRDAAMNAKPELEIYADDVQCAHGSTVGELDRQALFYLMSRGIPELEARRLLILAFIDEALDEIADAPAREEAKALTADWLQSRGADQTKRAA